MAVQVRFFAALREAAGTARTEVAPGALSDALAELSARYGQRFAERLSACSVLVDGQPAGPDAQLDDGAELVLLPPVSGGASDLDAPVVEAQMALLSAGVPVLLVAALVAGHPWFPAAVVILACWVLVDVGEVLSAAAGRPVLLAAALPAVGLPLAVAFRDGGWEQIPAWVAASLLLASALVLAFGRRRNVTAGLGSTLTAGLLVGLGASGLLLLLDLPAGFRWVLAVLVTVAAADLAGGLAGRLFGVQPVIGIVAGAAGAGVVATLALRPTLDGVPALMIVVAVVVAAVGGSETHRALAEESGRDPDEPSLVPGSGGPLGAADGVLLAAPVVYLVARATGL